jgi:hypothetical protein
MSTPLHVTPATRAAEAPPTPMQAARRWLHYALEERRKPDGTLHYAKVPYYIDGERRRGDLGQDGGRLVTYAEACAMLPVWGAARAGLGFALGEGWQGVDFDKVSTRPELAALVAELPGYVELSPSGNGYHAIGFGAPFQTLGSNSSGIEAYALGRFFTFTGHALRPGQQLTDLAPFIAEVLAPRHGAHRRAREIPPSAAAAPTGEREVDELADALRYLDADDRDTWIRIGQALYTLGEKGFALWSAWSATSSRFPGGDDLERFETFSGSRTSWQSVFNQAAAAGWRNPRRLDPAAIFAGSNLVTCPPGLVAEPGGVAANAPRAPMPLPPGMVVPPPPVPSLAAARLGGQDFRDPAGQQRAATLENVVDALSPTSGVVIRYDTFQDALMIATATGYRPVNDDDIVEARVRLGRSGFKPVGPEVARSAFGHVGKHAASDSALDWVSSLVWDGVPRIDTALPRYFRTVDTPYTRAVGAYLFTALAGRALTVQPLQADMAVILVGLQGARKTSAVAALAPWPSAFGEVDLGKRDDDLARRLRGKLVVEWAEMRGLSGRDQQGIKAWITRRTESWVPKFKEYAGSFTRRCIVIGTSNTNELLDDPTGERRWLPVTAGEVDVESLERDRDQLWAEGAARFRAAGIAWEEAERLARDVHADFKVTDDSWSVLIARWLETVPGPFPRIGETPRATKNGDAPFAMADLLVGIGVDPARITRSDELRAGKILRVASFESGAHRVGEVFARRWRKKDL